MTTPQTPAQIARRNETSSRWRRDNPEAVRASYRKYFYTTKGTVTNLLKFAKRRAKDENLPYELDREFVESRLANGVCEVTGLLLERVPPEGCHIHPYAPSLDKIDPALGYTKENTRMVCFAYNRAKSDWNDEVFRRVAEAFLANNPPASEL